MNMLPSGARLTFWPVDLVLTPALIIAHIVASAVGSKLIPEGGVRQSARRQHDHDKLQKLAPAPQMDLFSEA